MEKKSKNNNTTLHPGGMGGWEDGGGRGESQTQNLSEINLALKILFLTKFAHVRYLHQQSLMFKPIAYHHLLDLLFLLLDNYVRFKSCEGELLNTQSLHFKNNLRIVDIAV